jgi:hypothetical protein
MLRDAPTVLHSTTVRSVHTVFICFVFIWEQTATCVASSIKWLVFITEMKSVYCAVRTKFLNKAVWAWSLKVNIVSLFYLTITGCQFFQHFYSITVAHSLTAHSRVGWRWKCQSYLSKPQGLACKVTNMAAREPRVLAAKTCVFMEVAIMFSVSLAMTPCRTVNIFRHLYLR